ncbi:hypothetical protein ACSYDW_01400 [Paeniglutamicibacter sp. R2-26]|uniref:hypothetical protein n=1 Tax=Paeniglutamicibacter sp. R2-26 TaxID=3144417 RepID=UPI003EE46574
MDTPQFIITILGAGTGGAILKSIVSACIKFFSGTAGREKVRNADMRTQRNEAWADAERERARADASQVRADMEARNRNRLADYAAALRRDCMEHGVTPPALRPWPDLETESTSPKAIA